MNVFLFGDSNATAKSFKNLIAQYPKNFYLKICSRSKGDFYIDLDNPYTYRNLIFEGDTVFISFAPIWKFSSFLKEVSLVDKFFLKKIKLIIACSSSSIATKRYAFNNFDKELFYKLKNAEDKLADLCSGNDVIYKIIRPTLIYGDFGAFKDKNFNKLKLIMKIFPIILFPKNSGLRQPVHCSQLAEFIFQLVKNGNNLKHSEDRIFVGGDLTLTYLDMIKEISNTIPKKLFFGNCKVLLLPNRLFYFLISPIYIFSPKLFESLLRISSDLSGFTPIYKLIPSKQRKRLLIDE